MRSFLYLSFVLLLLDAATCLQAASATDPVQVWKDLQTKREALKSFHQEFVVSRSFKVAQHTQASEASIVIDGAGVRWREQLASGSEDRVTVFDGKDWFEFENGGDEYVRLKHGPKQGLPQPELYGGAHLELSKAIERDHRPCGIPKLDHECLTIDVPLQGWVHNGQGGITRSLGGSTRMIFDAAIGLLISSRTVENVDNGHGGYQSDTTYKLKRLSYNGEVDESLFRIPSTVAKEVKELSRWNAEKIKKQLSGKTAPDFTLTDIQGKTIRLSDLKGRTVLLDFWATWCGPCRADAPALDKLYQKYGGKELTIIGLSVNEERPVVQKFLSEHPHPYTIALTSENEMPRPYQIGVFPTYIVIDTEGNLVSATEGEKGFSELRRMLKKAGLDTN
jgi:thiol-disulfide isomerase/thioredoxin